MTMIFFAQSIIPNNIFGNIANEENSKIEVPSVVQLRGKANDL
jgi:hypothetical protein